MDKNKLSYYKNKLLKEKQEINEVMKNMENNFTNAPLNMRSSELSYYDNDMGDIAGDLVDLEIGMALEKNEEDIRGKIDLALQSIDKGTYGICKCCGKEIPMERLQVIPYAQCCVKCQNNMHKDLHDGVVKRPIEEEVIGTPFYKDSEFSIEDTYEKLSDFNDIENTYEYYEDEPEYVDQMDLISNEQYKNSLS